MRIWSWFQSESAEDSFEYLLAIGLVAVPLAAGLIFGLSLLLPEAASFICRSIDTAGPVDACFP
jgi:hypothetical protein